MRSSLTDVSNMPKKHSSSFSVVDLNNKETQSILLIHMKSQEKEKLELRRIKQAMMLESQSTSSSMHDGLTSGVSSSSCSSVSAQSPTKSLSPTANNSALLFDFNDLPANSSNNSSGSMPDRCESICLNSSYPLYKRLYKNLNSRHHHIVMSQENLSHQLHYQPPQQSNNLNSNIQQLNNQQQLQKQQIYQNSNSVGYTLPNITNNSNHNNTFNNGPDRDAQRVADNSEESKNKPQHSVTISSQLQHEQLQKLQNQAASNLAINLTLDGSELSQSHSSSISTTSSTMITLTGAIPKDYESGDETDEEENEVLEESPEGRWIKRNESVSQRDVPGIDQAFLAMDTEYGIEVVWNEINLLGGKKLRNSQEEIKIDIVFEKLISLNHPNIVKFHKYWRDKNKKFPRIIFITEYMSSGSLKQFLRKAKRTNQPIKKSTWKRWCIQLLTALHYLHNTEVPIVHGNLSGETIFIQHNGLIKIGSIAPDIVNAHVKTCINNSWWTKNRHFMAPELHEIYFSKNLSSESAVTSASSLSNTLQINNPETTKLPDHSTPAVDIYSFGMVALEMFNLEFGGNGDTHTVTPELIKQSIETLDAKQQDFLNKCLDIDPLKRPNAKELLFHPLLFEVPTLRLLAAHQIIKIQNGQSNGELNIFNDSDFHRDLDYVIASTNRYYNTEQSDNIPNKITLNKSISSSSSNSNSSSLNSLSSSPTIAQQSSKHQQLQHQNSQEKSKDFNFKYSMLSPFEANKYLEDVKNGIYPLTAYGLDKHPEPTEFFTEEIEKDDVIPYGSSEILPSSYNNEHTYIIRTSLSPSSRSLSGTNTSLASTNLSSASSSSSTSPSQSLSQVILQQVTNQTTSTSQLNQNFDHIYQHQNKSYSPPISNLILNNNLMLNNISQTVQNSTNCINSNVQSQNIDQLSLYNNNDVDQNNAKLKKLLIDQDQDNFMQHHYNNGQYNTSNTQVSSSNSSTAPTPTPFHQQQFMFSGASDQSSISKYASPSESPPPPQVQPYQNGSRSLSKSPVRNTNNSSQHNGQLQENGCLNGLDEPNFERRHAVKMEFYLAFIEKYNNYKLSLNITFDDKTSRFVESQINHTDTANKLTEELIQFGLVSEVDKESLYDTLSKALSKRNLSNSFEQASEALNGNINSQTNMFFLNK